MEMAEVSPISDVLDKIKNLETSLKCNICDNILKDPFLLVKCGHSVCKPCYPGNLECPVCETHSQCIEDKQLQELLSNFESLKHLLDGKTPEIIGSKKTPCSSADSVVMATPDIQKNPVLAAKAVILDNESPIPSRARKSTKSSVSSSSAHNTPDVSRVRNSSKSSVSPTTPVETVTPTDKTKRRSGSKPSPATPNVDKKNHKGETQLQRAVIKGDVSKVTELLAAGATVNTQDNNGWTPLHEASSHGHIAIVNLLLDHGALVNVPSYNDHITPLHDALVNGKLEIAKLLVEKGADMHARTSDGYTALSIVKNEKDKTMLIEACSPFIQAHELPTEPTKSDGKIVFLATHLNEEQQDKLQKCAKLLNADIVEEFKAEVTHIVATCDNSGNCTRTMKILLGIITGKWLMNYQWVEICLEYKHQVEEEVFEVQGTKSQPNTMGPKKARQNCFKKLPPLLEGFHFYLQGQFSSPGRSEIMRLITSGGGHVLSREPRITDPSDVVMPYHADDTVFQTVDTVILTAHKSDDGKLWSGNITSRPVSWLIACISEFKILDRVDDHGKE